MLEEGPRGLQLTQGGVALALPGRYRSGAHCEERVERVRDLSAKQNIHSSANRTFARYFSLSQDYSQLSYYSSRVLIDKSTSANFMRTEWKIAHLAACCRL